MLKQEPASRGVGIPVLQGGEDVKKDELQLKLVGILTAIQVGVDDVTLQVRPLG